MAEATPHNVLAYEPPVSDRFGRRWRVIAIVLAGLSLLVGLGQAAGGVWVGVGVGMDPSDPEALIWVPVMAVAAVAGLVASGAAVLAIARRAPRAVPIALAAAAALTALVAMAMMGVAIAYRHATEWDQLVVVIGIVFAAAAGTAAFLYVGAGLAVLRVRRLAGDGSREWHIVRWCLLAIPMALSAATFASITLVYLLP